MASILGSGAPSYRRSIGMDENGIDELLSKGRHETDEAKRRAIYADLSRLCAEQVPLCMLNYHAQAYGLRKNVKDFQTLPGLLLLNSGGAFDTAYLA